MDQIQYTGSSEYAQAMRSIRMAKNIFWLVAVLAIVVQAGSFVLIHFMGVLGSAMPVASQPANVAAWTKWSSWGQLMHWVLPTSKFLGFVSATLLALTMLFAVKIALLGRRAGLATMISAFFWSLILLACLTPWQQVLQGSYASGALYNLDEMRHWNLKDSTVINQVLFFGRFLAYPAVSLLAAVIVAGKFAIASRAVSGTPTIRLAAPVVPEKA